MITLFIVFVYCIHFKKFKLSRPNSPLGQTSGVTDTVERQYHSRNDLVYVQLIVRLDVDSNM